MESLGEKIYKLRNEANISQDALAEKLNVSRQTVSRWETDNSKPTEKNLKCICAIFSVDRNYFAVENEVSKINEPTVKTMSNRFNIAAIIVVGLFLLCVVAACCAISYVSLLPSDSNGLDIAAANRFHYIGIACISVGAVALVTLAALVILLIKSRKKTKKISDF